MNRAGATITAATVERYRGALAADSLLGRTTPSSALERTARYIAAEFHRLGLRPGADHDQWIWRYQVPGQLAFDYEQSQVSFTVQLTAAGIPIRSEAGEEMARSIDFTFTADAYFAPEVGPPVIAQPLQSFLNPVRNGSRRIVVLAGRQTVATVARGTFGDAVIFYCPGVNADTPTQQQILRQLYSASAGVVLVSDADAGNFAAALARARTERVTMVDSYMRGAQGVRRWPWAAVVRAERVRRVFAAMGLDLAQLCTDTVPITQELPAGEVWLTPAVNQAGSFLTAPLVVGMVEGADSVLKEEALVIAAPMDVGDSGRRDRRTVDAEGAGAAGLLALAQAFSRPENRPRRSILLLATSGRTKGQAWGSNAYVMRKRGSTLEGVTGLLALELGGRSPRNDTLWIDGLQDVDVARPLAWVAAMHPELGLVVADGGTVIQPPGDHFAFVRQGIPSLAFQTSTQDDPTTPEEAARLLQFVFYLSKAMADADDGPLWRSEARPRLLSIFTP